MERSRHPILLKSDEMVLKMSEHERSAESRQESTRISRNEETGSEQMNKSEVNKCQFTLGRRVFMLQSEHITDSKKMLT